MPAQARQVEKGIGTALAPLLALPGARHLGRGLRGVIPSLRLGVERGAFPGHGQVQVDTIEQRPREFVAIALDLLRGTAAAATGFAQVATGAGVHVELLLANPIEGNRTVVEHAPETQLLESKNG